MSGIDLILGPNSIFKETALSVTEFDIETEKLCEDLVELMYREHAIGVAAPMIGVLKRVIAFDLQENDNRNPTVMINPVIANRSTEVQKFEEASICFPGISAEVIRYKSISVEYFDKLGEKHQMSAEGYLATVIQHEMDYLDGKLFLDYLSPIKRKMLMKKYRKANS